MTTIVVDTSEHVEPVPFGWIDPADQILSDEETSPLEWESHPPRPRIWGDRDLNEGGFRQWRLRLPSGATYVYDCHAEAAEALRLFAALGLVTP